MTTISGPAYVDEIEAARQRREDRLRGEQSWFNVVGLHWLAQGTSTLGSDPANDVVLPGGPLVVGAIDVRDGTASLRATSPEATVDGEHAGRRTLVPDTEPNTTFVSVGRVRFHLIVRGGTLALRVVDLESRARRSFAGLDYFAIDQRWRLEAAVSPPFPSRETFPSVLGGEALEQVAAVVSFLVDGQRFEILALQEEGSDGLFLIFGDLTNRESTYEAGRYLYTPPVVDGRVTVDFNLAFNPPCAFTHAATCSLPPARNRLPIAITAGERRYGGLLAGA
ncbi:MAG TPA: DUF1684 domain-containing protein [Candidatus Acidoferrum sp.]|nr:DUF1684 domain-containing protein [Candidatus Acidoferrum sp.]